ncbi:protein indeterminate-domain 12-like [Coffea arabica]|uniref:Protein indeterminate-domain 12-like n=1 Tax=Coffea arabica TaxID=13443 RepID=A0ABM4X5B7_COFAR
MFHYTVMSNSASLSEEASVSSVSKVQDFGSLNPMVQTSSSHQQPQKIKKKRNLPGNPDPDAEVIALSPKTLLATNRFVCEICNKGFQRDQNLQLHRRGHNLPWKLKQRNNKEIKKRAYVCPEPTCVHHHPSRALGDLTGIKKHYCRKHGEKKWKCEKCSKIYAVQSDWKAHTKTCGTREYRCDCGTLFSRKDSFITHRAFCDALAQESARLSANSVLAATAAATVNPQLFRLNFHQTTTTPSSLFPFPPTQHDQQQPHFPNPPTPTPTDHHISLNHPWVDSCQNPKPTQYPNQPQLLHDIKPETLHLPISSPFLYQEPPPPTHKRINIPSLIPVQTQLNDTAGVHHLSATALLQKAATLGAHSVGHVNSAMTQLDMSTIGHVTNGIPPEYSGFTTSANLAAWQKSDRLTRDFLGLTGDHQSCGGGGGSVNGNGNGNIDVNVNVNMRGVLSFTGSVEFPATYERDLSLLKHQSFGFAEPAASEAWRNCSRV